MSPTKKNSHIHVLFPLLILVSLAWGILNHGLGVAGLISDFFGVFILGYNETMRAGPTLLKYLERADGGKSFWAQVKKQPFVSRIPLWIAAKMGPYDVMNLNQEPELESYPIKAW